MANIKASSSINSGPVSGPPAPNAGMANGTEQTKTGVPRSPGNRVSTFGNSGHSRTELMPTSDEESIANIELQTPKEKEVPENMQEKTEGTAAPDFLNANEENEESGFAVVGQKKYKKVGRRKENSVQYETKLEILKEYLAGVNTKDIAEKYGISRQYVYYILEQPEIKKIMKAQQESQTAMLMNVFKQNNKVIEQIFNLYFQEAVNEGRIKESSLPQLFTVLGIVFDKNAKLEELNLKREELELKKQEMSNQTDTSGLLSQFVQVLNANNKLPPRKEE